MQSVLTKSIKKFLGKKPPGNPLKDKKRFFLSQIKFSQLTWPSCLVAGPTRQAGKRIAQRFISSCGSR